jgi:hypothetical protein
MIGHQCVICDWLQTAPGGANSKIAAGCHLENINIEPLIIEVQKLTG